MFQKILCFIISCSILMTASGALAATRHHSGNELAPKQYLTKNGKVNINTIDEKDLVKVKGIGPKRAAEIVAYRKKAGPFKNVEDILNVKGIGPKLFAKIQDELAVA